MALSKTSSIKKREFRFKLRIAHRHTWDSNETDDVAGVSFRIVGFSIRELRIGLWRNWGAGKLLRAEVFGYSDMDFFAPCSVAEWPQ